MQTRQNETQMNHGLMMLICCLTPLIIAGILFYFGYKSYAILAAMLLCPILHYLLMKVTPRNKKARCH